MAASSIKWHIRTSRRKHFSLLHMDGDLQKTRRQIQRWSQHISQQNREQGLRLFALWAPLKFLWSCFWHVTREGKQKLESAAAKYLLFQFDKGSGNWRDHSHTNGIYTCEKQNEVWCYRERCDLRYCRTCKLRKLYLKMNMNCTATLQRVVWQNHEASYTFQIICNVRLSIYHKQWLLHLSRQINIRLGDKICSWNQSSITLRSASPIIWPHH